MILIMCLLYRVFFMYKYDMEDVAANTVSSIVYIISAFASPILGIIVDKTGRNIMWVGIACVITIVSHGIMAFTFLNPYIPMVSVM